MMVGSHVHQTITFYDGKDGRLWIKLDDGAQEGRMVVDRMATEDDKKLHSQPYARYLRTKAKEPETDWKALVVAMGKERDELMKDMARKDAEIASLQAREIRAIKMVQKERAKIVELEAEIARLSQPQTPEQMKDAAE